MRFLVRRLKSWEDRMNIGNIFYVLLYKLLRFISEDLCRTRTLHLSSANMRIWEYGTGSRRFADFQFHRLLGLSVDWCGNWDCRNPHFRFASSMGLKMVKLMIGLGWSVWAHDYSVLTDSSGTTKQCTLMYTNVSIEAASNWLDSMWDVPAFWPSELRAQHFRRTFEGKQCGARAMATQDESAHGLLGWGVPLITSTAN